MCLTNGLSSFIPHFPDGETGAQEAEVTQQASDGAGRRTKFPRYKSNVSQTHSVYVVLPCLPEPVIL